MNANKLADYLDNANGFQHLTQLGLASQAAAMLRSQEVEIERINAKHEEVVNQLQDIISKHNDEKKAMYNLIVEQDKKIIELATKLEYANRTVELTQEIENDGSQ